MSRKIDGGAAFPAVMSGVASESKFHGAYELRFDTADGMSLRDYFASQALQFLQVDGAYGDYVALASAAYRVADAMLAERAK